MAAGLVQDQAALDLAATLEPADIPTKLRCAVCNQLAVNAFKLPCCDQAICQYCQASLPESCPVCSHSPLEADMCKPHKALRMTIKVHLKTEEKKRAAAEAATPPVPRPTDTPAPPAAAPSEHVEPVPERAETEEEQVQPNSVHVDGTNASVADPGATDPMAQVEEPSEHIADEQQPRPDHTEHVNQTPGVEADTVVQTTEGEEQDVKDGYDQETDQNGSNDGQVQNAPQGQGMNGNMSFDASNQNFANMDWNAGATFNPMMNMSNMQQGWGGFNNMMGMSMGNMAMFGGFGAGGMGMNDMSGMNMGMGFGGGFGGNWNAQQGMGGNFGAGFYPNAGYNQPQMHQGAYGNQMHNQQFPNHNYQNRFQGQRGGAFPRGGRGGFAGRGGHHINQIQPPTQSRPAAGQYATSDGFQGDRRPSQAIEETGHPSSEKPDDHSALPVDEDHARDMSAQGDVVRGAADEDPHSADQVAIEGGDANAYHDDEMHADGASQQGLDINGMNSGALGNMAGQVVDQDMTQQYSNDPAQGDGFYVPANFQAGFHRGRGAFRGRGRGRGAFGAFANNMHDAYAHQDNFTVVAGIESGPPINAPTGPKAMREGKPNTGFYSRVVPVSVQPAPSAASQKEASHTPAVEQEPIVQQGDDAIRSRSRSRSSQRKRKYRQRSTSAGVEEDEAYESRRERRRDNEDSYADERQDEGVDGDTTSRKSRSRAASPGDESRGGHRSRRDKERDKHRSSRSHRDSSREHRRDRHRHRSRSPARTGGEEDYSNGNTGEDLHSESGRHRSRRDRDKERDRDSHRDRDRGDRDREREREKDRSKRSSRRDRSASTGSRDKDDKYSSSRRDRRDQRNTNNGDREAMAPPPASDDLGFKIKGSRSAKAPPTTTAPPTGASSKFAPPTGPRRDRDRERERDRDRSGRDRTDRNSNNRDRERASKDPRRSNTNNNDSTDVRRESVQSVAFTSAATKDKSTPVIDIHAQEREARNRERMLKEQQRRGIAPASALGKRSRGSIEESNNSASFDPPTGPRAERRDGGTGGGGRKKRNRRTNHKYDDDEVDERRAARVEEEREASRWD
ncbi:hypothetical protein AAFC00_005791 [Neodothiora populina]|uniref:RING-type domain-containing protein n=1 Tax=Neodothiora populina TaxID=2781224 RepID=A0ABR3P6H7_9PEZI